MINTVYFSPKFTMPYMTLGDAQTCAAHYVSQILLPKSCHPHSMYWVHLKLINPLDVVNIVPDHPPGK